jgi:hypothetical protein
MAISSTSAPAHGAPPLRCLDGASAPPAIATDLSILSTLPEVARRALWTALGPSLQEPLAPTLEAQLDDFCRRYRVNDDDLARVLKSCRFLVREGARRDLPLNVFLADVTALVGEEEEIHAVLGAGYERARALLRRDFLGDALRAQGTVLTGIHWRLDTLRASSSGLRASADVALMTLDYAEGERPGRLVLHLPLTEVEDLKRVCDEILENSRR